MQCGGARRREALSWCKTIKREAGDGVVLETAGRVGHSHPPGHSLMTSGGMTPPKRWQEGEDCPCEGLHRQWQYPLCTLVKHRVGPPTLRRTIDALWRQYPRGLGASLEEGKVPAGGEGLAYPWAQDVVRPPISLRWRLRDDRP